MRIQHIIYTMLIALSTAVLMSCYEDKGNYDYRDIDEIQVNFPGHIGTDNKIRYAERQGETLAITPEVECLDKSHLTYLWERYTDGVETETLKKTKGVVSIAKDASKEDALAAGKAAIADKLTGNVIKEIYVPGKIINIVMK